MNVKPTAICEAQVWGCFTQKGVLMSRKKRLGYEKAKEIRLLYAAGCSLTEIGKMYDVKPEAVFSIVNGKSYKKLPPTWELWKNLWKEE